MTYRPVLSAGSQGIVFQCGPLVPLAVPHLCCIRTVFLARLHVNYAMNDALDKKYSLITRAGSLVFALLGFRAPMWQLSLNR